MFVIFPDRPHEKLGRDCAPRDWKTSGPPGRRLNTGSEGNERATEAIKECAVTRSATKSTSTSWQGASVDPYVAPARVVQEREIPADVQGCCCGAEP